MFFSSEAVFYLILDLSKFQMLVSPIYSSSHGNQQTIIHKQVCVFVFVFLRVCVCVENVNSPKFSLKQ